MDFSITAQIPEMVFSKYKTKKRVEMDFSATAHIPEMDFAEYKTKKWIEMDFSVNRTDTGDGLLRVQHKEMGRDGLLHDHAGTSRTGVGYGRSIHGRTDDDVTDD